MTNTDAVLSIVAEAAEHATRHGFEVMEEKDAYCYTGTGGWEALFRIYPRFGTVEVEVIRYSASRSQVVLHLREFMGAVHPDAVFLDEVEEALVAAIRLVKSGSGL